MQNRQLAASQLREVLYYVARFENSTLAIAVDGRALEDNDILAVAGDIVLLRTVGIRVGLVLGFTDQADSYKSKKKREIEARLESLAEQLCQSINTLHLGYLTSGLQELAVRVGEVDMAGSFSKKIQDALSAGLLPIVIAKPSSTDGEETWFSSLLRVTTSLCQSVLTDKLIYLSCVDGLLKDDNVLIREAQPNQIQQLVTDGIITGQFVEFAATAKKIIEAGVMRVHVINGRHTGGLLKEVFTRDGIGTMIHQNHYQEVRSALASDVSGILDVTGVLEASGDARRHRRGVVESQLANYRVVVKDNEVIACGCLNCFPDEKKATIQSLGVDPSYLSNGTGEILLEHLFSEARKAGARQITLVSPNIGQWWLSQKFITGKISDLPVQFQTGPRALSSSLILSCQLED